VQVPLELRGDDGAPERALELLDALGVKEIAVFERRERHMEPLG